MVEPTILQIMQIYYPVLASFGLPANLVTIVILSRGNCGLSKCITIYMVAMATADLLVIIFNVIVYQIFSKLFPHSFLSYTAVCNFIVYMQCNNVGISVLFTVSFTFDRFVAICCHTFKANYCTVRTASAVITTVSVLIGLLNIPMCFAFEHKLIINNIPWGLSPKLDFFSSTAVRRILVASRARQGLRSHSSENQNDPEMENRRKSIILLFTVSGSFILLWLTAIASNLTSGPAVHYRPEYTAPAYIAIQTGNMLLFLSSCTNTCIYAATQTKFREELKQGEQKRFLLKQRTSRPRFKANSHDYDSAVEENMWRQR
ncbi:probable G-protein coupled receptor 139 [Heptranchias perlo]|uniref:probable G-protein coupled receptor 139 n=1 Tax=Heptranchias perlo TaxID=212740 RepID=UPI0035597FE8